MNNELILHLLIQYPLLSLSLLFPSFCFSIIFFLSKFSFSSEGNWTKNIDLLGSHRLQLLVNFCFKSVHVNFVYARNYLGRKLPSHLSFQKSIVLNSVQKVANYKVWRDPDLYPFHTSNIVVEWKYEKYLTMHESFSAHFIAIWVFSFVIIFSLHSFGNARVSSPLPFLWAAAPEGRCPIEYRGYFVLLFVRLFKDI